MKKGKPATAVTASAPLLPAEIELTAPMLHANLTLVETADADLMEELLADLRVGPLLVARLSECVAVVPADKSPELHRWLLKAGHTPRVLDEKQRNDQ